MCMAPGFIAFIPGYGLTVRFVCNEGRADRVEQSQRGSLDEIEHLLEVLGRAIIRIGHLEDTEPGGEIEKQAEMAGVVARAEPVQHPKICHVHRQDPFEASEVVAVDAACAAVREVVAAPARVGDRAPIRRFPELIVVCRGGIDDDPFGEPCLRNEHAEHPFRDRRAANVARADEEHSDGMPSYPTLAHGTILAAMAPPELN